MSSGESKADIARQLKEIVDKYEVPVTAIKILSDQDANIVQQQIAQLKRIGSASAWWLEC